MLMNTNSPGSRGPFLQKNKKTLFTMTVTFICMLIISCKVKLAEPFISASPGPSPTATPFTSNSTIVNSLGQVEFRRILSGDKSNVRNYEVRVSEDEVAFQQLWDDHTGSKTNPIFLPKVDFEQKNVVAIFLGDRPSTGFDVEIEKIEETADSMQIFIKEITPSPGQEVKAEITQPFLIIETKKTKKKIVFENSSINKAQAEDVTFKSLEVGFDSGIKTFSQRVARNEKEFSDLYKEHLSGQKNIVSPVFPIIDFNKEMVAAIFLGERPTNDYAIDIKKVTKTESQIIISASEIPPTGDVVQISTSPFNFITLPKSNLPVSFDISLIVPPTGQIKDSSNGENNVKNLSLAIKPLASGDNSFITNSLYTMVRSSDEFKDLWARHTNNSVNNKIPEVDFALYNVIAVFIGKRETTGIVINIGTVIEASEEVRVFVELAKDKNNAKNLPTTPFQMVLIPKTGKPASFIINNLL
jgi:hypothetical protein